MMKISDAVKETLSSSEIALAAFNEDYLNLSSYALSIKKEIEKKTKKQVKLGSIVVALSRLKKIARKSTWHLPSVSIEDIAVRVNLIEISFDRTSENLEKIALLYKKNSLAKDYLLVSHGVGEISIITLASAEKYVLNIFRDKPKIIVSPLVSITLRLRDDYINTPNVIYKFVREFSIKNITIVELISTYTEISFILFVKDKETALAILSKEI